MKYRAQQRLPIYRPGTSNNNPFLESNLIVGYIEAGQIFEVEKTGGGGTGFRMVPYLIFANGDYVVADYAEAYNGDESTKKPKYSNPIDQVQTYLPDNNLGKIILGVVVIFLLLKIFKVI